MLSNQGLALCIIDNASDYLSVDAGKASSWISCFCGAGELGFENGPVLFYETHESMPPGIYGVPMLGDGGFSFTEQECDEFLS